MTATLLRFLAFAWKPILALLGAVGLYAKGRADAATKAKVRDLKADVETRRRIDAADTVGNDPDAARRWLHERGKSGGDL